MNKIRLARVKDLYTKFRRNRSTGSTEKYFNVVVFIKYGHGSHPGHVTNIIFINFHFLVYKSLHTNLIENGQVVSEKSRF